MRLFVPPGRLVRRQVDHPLFGRMRQMDGVTVLKEDGLYRQVQNPTPEEIEAAEAAYVGGHEYVISIEEADALTAAGYGEWIDAEYGYGAGDYGEGLYGGHE